jgi:hypothetical protein
MDSSLVVSPAKPERGRNLADGVNSIRNSIRPLNLVDKLKRASKATWVDEELARSIIDDPDWKGEGTMQDGIFEELMKEEASLTMSEEEEEPSYDFGALNEMDDATWHLLKLIDVVKLEQLMLEKVSESQR